MSRVPEWVKASMLVVLGGTFVCIIEALAIVDCAQIGQTAKSSLRGHSDPARSLEAVVVFPKEFKISGELNGGIFDLPVKVSVPNMFEMPLSETTLIFDCEVSGSAVFRNEDPGGKLSDDTIYKRINETRMLIRTDVKWGETIEVIFPLYYLRPFAQSALKLQVVVDDPTALRDPPWHSIQIPPKGELKKRE